MLNCIKLPFCLHLFLYFFFWVWFVVPFMLTCSIYSSFFSPSANTWIWAALSFGLPPFLWPFFLWSLSFSPVLTPSISPNFVLSLLTFSLSCPPSVIVIRGVRGDQREESRTSTTDLSPPSLSLFSLFKLAFFLSCVFYFGLSFTFLLVSFGRDDRNEADIFFRTWWKPKTGQKGDIFNWSGGPRKTEIWMCKQATVSNYVLHVRK